MSTSAITFGPLVPGTLLPAAAGTIFTATSACQIVTLSLSNTNTGAENTVTLYLVRTPGGSVGAGNEITPARVVARGVAQVALEWSGRNLAVGDAIFGFATNASQVLLIADGFTYTNS